LPSLTIPLSSCSDVLAIENPLFACRGGRLPLNVALRLAIGLFQGLAYLHARGYAHFDVKPENILVKNLSGQLTAIISDFGYAKKSTRQRDFGLRDWM
jgi:serine/threonine protein kinase